ncbi:hypothetical protein MRX96_017323 [Rhipicephalus microplus]
MNDAMGCNLARLARNKITDMAITPSPGEDEQVINDQVSDSNPHGNSDGSTAVGKQGASLPAPSLTSTIKTSHFVSNTPDKLLIGFLRRPPSATPLRIHRERSSSQIEFFRVLDEKINRGKDNCSDDGTSRCGSTAT